jgi:hypothetical protein
MGWLIALVVHGEEPNEGVKVMVTNGDIPAMMFPIVISPAAS